MWGRLARGRHPETGATLVELAVTVALLGLMAAIAVSGWSSWARANEHEGAATRLGTVLREAQQRAVTEGVSTCVDFDVAAASWTVYRLACNDPGRTQLVGPYDTGTPAVGLQDPSFTAAVGSTFTGVTFRPRGTAWKGSVKVTRDGSSKVYVVRTERLTGRVSVE